VLKVEVNACRPAYGMMSWWVLYSANDVSVPSCQWSAIMFLPIQCAYIEVQVVC
jgi:hypothetical protein